MMKSEPLYFVHLVSTLYHSTHVLALRKAPLEEIHEFIGSLIGLEACLTTFEKLLLEIIFNFHSCSILCSVGP
jgi:hypothetical protein